MDLAHHISRLIDRLNIRRGWQPYTALSDVTLEDGSKASGFMMRKRLPGAWVYRACTEDELRDQAYWHGIR
jgi:hypothetical protein